MEDIKSANRTEAIIHAVSKWLAIAGSAVLCILVALTTLDVLLRYFLNHPIKGVFELNELMMAAIVALSWGYTTYGKAHISVDLVVSHFSKRFQRKIEAFNLLLGILFWCLVVWQSLLYTLSSRRVNEHSDILEIPTFYFKAMIPLGAFLMTLELILNLIKAIRENSSR